MRRTLNSRAFATLLCVAGLMMGAAPALADRIDGEWCFAALSLTIDGPSIRTPGGSQINGNYSRHAFSYVVPSTEPEAGSEIDMRLLNEETMTLVRRNVTKPEETWRRCKVTS